MKLANGNITGSLKEKTKMIRKPVKDGLGNSVRSYDVKPKKLKLGSWSYNSKGNSVKLQR